MVAMLSEYDGLVKYFKPNKTGRVHINVALGQVCVPILPWKSNKYYVF